MSLMLLGGIILIVSSIAISALLIFRLRSSGSRGEQLDVETCKARLKDIEARLKRGKLNEAEADAARLALLSQLRSPSWGFGRDLRVPRKLIAPAAVFLLVAVIGSATSYVAEPPEAAGSTDTNSFSVSGSGSDDETLASLMDYTRSIGAEEPASTPADGKLLPDVNTMIERLAARLETAPVDGKGWRMLGWSYFHTARYQQAASAYARAVELDPNSAEVERAYEEAKAKAAESGNSEIATS
jgi:cytochrome c-type biogenesis protein CcmH